MAPRLRKLGALIVPMALVVGALVPSGGAAATGLHQSAPGCGRFCRNAGGFGGTHGPAAPHMKLLVKRVQVHGDTVSLPLLCQARRACRGALLLEAPSDKPSSPPQIDLARSDLLVPAHTEWLIVMKLNRNGLADVHAHHRLRATLVAAFETKNRRVTPERQLPVTVLG